MKRRIEDQELRRSVLALLVSDDRHGMTSMLEVDRRKRSTTDFVARIELAGLEVVLDV